MLWMPEIDKILHVANTDYEDSYTHTVSCRLLVTEESPVVATIECNSLSIVDSLLTGNMKSLRRLLLYVPNS